MCMDDKAEQRKIFDYVAALNKELDLDLDETGFDFSEEEREVYLRDLRALQNERRKHPNSPIYYSPAYIE